VRRPVRILDFKLTKSNGLLVRRDSKEVSVSLWSRPVGLGLYPDDKRRVPHISLVFREMWDSTNVSF
jgi:hypothetical protein